MNITINTEVLQEHDLSLGEFLLLLMGVYDVPIEKCRKSLVEKGLAYKDNFYRESIVLDEQQKERVIGILAESSEVVRNSGIDFRRMAARIREIYPDGNKPGKSYSWRGTEEEIMHRLCLLAARCNFLFSEQECVLATKRYVEQFKEDNTCMSILRNFILKTVPDEQGYPETTSQLMSYIEQIRDEFNELNEKQQENDLYD